MIRVGTSMIFKTLFLLSMFIVQNEENDEASILNDLKASRDILKSQFTNCIIKSKRSSSSQGKAGETTHYTFASKQGAVRLDTSRNDPHQQVKCITKEKSYFRAVKLKPDSEFSIAQKSESLDSVLATIDAQFRLRNASYGILNSDLVKGYDHPNAAFRNIMRSTDDDGNRLLTFESYDVTSPNGMFGIVKYVKFQGTDVWALKEYDSPNTVFQNEYVVEDGLPLIKRTFLFAYDTIDRSKRKEEPSATTVCELTDFSPEPPPAKYFTLEGLNISIEKKSSIYYWLLIGLCGVALIGAVAWIKKRKQE